MLSIFRRLLIAAIVGSTAMALTPDGAEAFQRRGGRDGDRSAQDRDRNRREGDRSAQARRRTRQAHFRGRHHPRGRYWNNYWRWYDNDYRPYWHRRNRYRNRFDNDFGFRYNRGYRYYTPYYGYGHSLRGPHNSLQLGPLHFDWR